jgi:copper chaperone CopZ
MFGLFKKQNMHADNAQSVTLSITGMHCQSCALNIDGALEDTPGVISASTNFARANVQVSYDATKVQVEELVHILHDLGYEASSSQ